MDGRHWNVERRTRTHTDLTRIVNEGTLGNMLTLYGNSPIEVQVWEDDQQACKVYSNEDYGASLFNLTAFGYYAHETIGLKWNAALLASSKVFYPVAAAYYLGKAYDKITGGDDALLGRAVFNPLGGNVANLNRKSGMFASNVVDENGWIDLQVAWW